MSEEGNDKIAQLKKAVRNAESQLAYYRKRYNAVGAPPSVTPYLKLATIYRKQRNYQAEVEILERFVKQITTQDGQVNAFQQSTRNMLTRLERARELSKQEPEGTCEGCGNSPRLLTKIESGQLVCVTCLREIRGPRRAKDLATPEQIAHLREQGFDVQDDLPKMEHRRLTVMITLRDRGVPFNSSATSDDLEELQRRTYVNHRSVTVAGVSYSNRDGTNRQQIVAHCSAGELLRLKREEDNPVDPNAVAVVRLNGEQLGYLHREDAVDVIKGSEDGWTYAGVINEILDDGVRGHYLGVGMSLVYAHSTADKAAVTKHVTDLIRKYRGDI
jgi:hypothetical protein